MSQKLLSVAATRARFNTIGLLSLINPYPIQGRLRQNPPGVGAGVGLGVGKGVGAAHHKSTTGQDGVSQTPCLAGSTAGTQQWARNWLSVAATSALFGNSRAAFASSTPTPCRADYDRNPPGVGAGVGLGVGKGVGAAHHKSTTGQDGVSQTPCLAGSTAGTQQWARNSIRSSDKRMFGNSRAAFAHPPLPHAGQITTEPTWGRRRSGAWGGQRRRRCTSQKHDRSGWCFSDTMFGSEALQAPSNDPETLSVAATSACLDTVGLPSLIHPYPIQGRLRQNPPGVGAGVGLGVGKGVGAAHHKSTTGQDGVSQTPYLAGSTAGTQQ